MAGGPLTPLRSVRGSDSTIPLSPVSLKPEPRTERSGVSAACWWRSDMQSQHQWPAGRLLRCAPCAARTETVRYPDPVLIRTHGAPPMYIHHLLTSGVLLALTLPAFADEPKPDKDGYIPLFDRKSLDNWVQRGGKAKYSVADGEIVGTAVPNTPNSFLCTKADYADFVLELEFKVDPKLNSGVQVRSQFAEEGKEVESAGKKIRGGPGGRVFGYQVEIDPS